MNKLLFAAAVFFIGPLFGDLADIRKDCHFLIYEEITTPIQFNTSDYWISVGRVQALSYVVYLIDAELQDIE